MRNGPAAEGGNVEAGGERLSLAGGKLVLDRPAEAVARLTISNPDRRNALDHEILEALAEALPDLDRGIEIRCVMITGAGEVFSAGYDIAGIPEESFATDAEALVAHPFHAAMEAVSAHPYPVLAAINGHCLGGGLELAIRCDLRLCAMSAKLGMPPAKLGLVYGHTGPTEVHRRRRSRSHQGAVLDRPQPERPAGDGDRPRARHRPRAGAGRRRRSSWRPRWPPTPPFL